MSVTLLLKRLHNKLISLNFKYTVNADYKAYIHLETPVKILGARNIKLLGSFQALSDLRIECISYYNNQQFNPELVIGNGVNMNTKCHIGCINKIIIGEGTLIGSNVLIIDHSHGDFNSMSQPPSSRPLVSKGPVIIGKNVWIGENVCILPGVSIGDGVVVGAGSVVTKSLPRYCIAGGAPARILKQC